MTYAVGSLVFARGRDWIVLPESSDDLLLLRPLGGVDAEVTGILPTLEEVRPARFDLPDPEQVGDYRYCRLLREAVRLGFRASSGPFRSFGRIGVEPRPYQLVALLMALKLDPVRLLIADDVGIGKTIEAGLVARELLDRGEVSRLAVLCPPHLAEQWQLELNHKFHIEAELMLPSTVRRLEAQCIHQSLFQRFPFLVISIDFIKSERYRYDFLRHCPELVIVDEAHTCAYGMERGRHRRHDLVRDLARNEDQHLVLVTATPHSGNEEAFRSLLALLKPEFASLPDDLTGKHNEPYRRALAQYFVQRRRADLRHYLQADTPFPDREEAEQTYALTPEYRRLFDKVLAFARETVRQAGEDQRRQRIRWWSVLALLRALASSPAAAASTLRNRAAPADAETAEEADELGRRAVMDLLDAGAEETLDVVPGSDSGAEDEEASRIRRRLLEMAREADALAGEKDAKLKGLLKAVDALLNDGFNPIVFCRFIPTAEYVASALREHLGRRAEVMAVTGALPPAEREQRVLALGRAERRILVATDCLSEGINLQDHFDAVIHYDLAWNPTRHEQREGRVDRYGQPKPIVRVLTYYGTDNQIDGVVLDVLLRKHKTIRSSLGISVPVPVDSAGVMEAIFESLLLRGGRGGEQYVLPGFEPVRDELFREWDNVSEREKRSRTLFAQETLKVDEVAAELNAVREAIGRGADVAWFVREALRAHGAAVSEGDPLRADLRELPRALRELLPVDDTLEARFELPVTGRELYLNRTHPLVEMLATYVMDTSLDPQGEGRARRCGVIRTGAVARRTTLLLLRLRYSIVTRRGKETRELLAEDCRLLAFEGAPANALWLDDERAEALLRLPPQQNIAPEQAVNALRGQLAAFDDLRPHLEDYARRHGEALLAAHNRVRAAARAKGWSTRVQPHLPPDVLGVYVYLPIPKL